jgi:hypothetical protein
VLLAGASDDVVSHVAGLGRLGGVAEEVLVGRVNAGRHAVAVPAGLRPDVLPGPVRVWLLLHCLWQVPAVAVGVQVGRGCAVGACPIDLWQRRSLGEVPGRQGEGNQYLEGAHN